jgi:hypothetical protein
VGLPGRAPRAAASALLLAIAIGVAGTTGIGAVFAADPPTVPLTGSLVNADGRPLPHVHLLVSEQVLPDGALAGFQASTGNDGVFRVDLFAWGTTDAPAQVTIKTPAHEQVTLRGDPCDQTYGIAVSDTRELALAEPNGDTSGAPKPIDVVATTTLLGEVCGTTGSPGPTDPGNGAAHSPAPRVTPPATDAARAALAQSEERLGAALILGFVAGLIAAAAVFARRPRGARRP